MAIAAIAIFGLPGVARAEGTSPNDRRQLWMPSLSYYPATWPRPRVGVDGAGQEGTIGSALTSGVADFWYQDWTLRCNAVTLQDRHYVPTIWGRDDMALFLTGTANAQAIVKSACNDGRPLLLFNEANSCTGFSACIRAEEAVVLLERVLQSGWHGPIYVGGLNMVGPSANNWTLALIGQWEKRHGTKAIPGIAGWHLHLYADHWSDPYGGTNKITVQNAPLIVHQAVWGQTDSLVSYVRARQAEGNASTIVVTEHGWLRNSIDDFGGVRKDAEAAALLRAFTQEFASVPEVAGWAWYAEYIQHITRDPVKDPAGYCSWCFDIGTLLDKAGPDQYVRTPAGDVWRDTALQLNTAGPAQSAAAR